MKTTLSSITFYPIKGLALDDDLVIKVLGSASWKFQNQPGFSRGKSSVPEYPLLIPITDVEIEILENEVFVIRDSTGKVTVRGILTSVDKPMMGTKDMLQSSQAVVFWPKTREVIGQETWNESDGCVTVVWKFPE